MVLGPPCRGVSSLSSSGAIARAAELHLVEESARLRRAQRNIKISKLSFSAGGDACNSDRDAPVAPAEVGIYHSAFKAVKRMYDGEMATSE
jgi:hypothetical protein